METLTGLAAQCSTSGRPAGLAAGGRLASLGLHAHAGCYLGRQAPSSSLRGTSLLPLFQSERRSAQSGQRCCDAHPRSGRRRGAAVTSAVFGGLGKLFKNDIAERTRGQYQVPGCIVAPEKHTTVRSALGSATPGGVVVESTLLCTFQGRVDAINVLEPKMKALSDEALRGCTEDLQARYERGETLDDLLVDAFAVRCTVQGVLPRIKLISCLCLNVLPSARVVPLGCPA